MILSIVKHPHIDDPYPSVFWIWKKDSQIRGEKRSQPAWVLVGAWDKWFREHRGGIPSCQDIGVMYAPPMERPNWRVPFIRSNSITTSVYQIMNTLNIRVIYDSILK